jgi:hypothetical protein
MTEICEGEIMEQCFNCGREIDKSVKNPNKKIVLFALAVISIFVVAFCLVSLYEESKKQDARKEKESLEQDVRIDKAMINSEKAMYGGTPNKSYYEKLSKSEAELRKYENSERDATDKRLKHKWLFWIIITGTTFFSGLIVFRN